jgi:hypothetical protein
MKNIILGNRIPYEYFITSGSGQSNVGSEGLPYVAEVKKEQEKDVVKYLYKIP